MAGVAVDESKGGYAFFVERFPEKKEALRRLFESSQSFQSLCEEYEACLHALKYWRESSLPEAPDFRNEFSTLLSELEEETLEHLNREIPDC
ncbi:MAG: hypothetical protein ABSG91_06335 [Syntrophobacteraceae bacterium]|jgi:transposase-like protein